MLMDFSVPFARVVEQAAYIGIASLAAIVVTFAVARLVDIDVPKVGILIVGFAFSGAILGALTGSITSADQDLSNLLAPALVAAATALLGGLRTASAEAKTAPQAQLADLGAPKAPKGRQRAARAAQQVQAEAEQKPPRNERLKQRIELANLIMSPSILARFTALIAFLQAFTFGNLTFAEMRRQDTLVEKSRNAFYETQEKRLLSLFEDYLLTCINSVNANQDDCYKKYYFAITHPLSIITAYNRNIESKYARPWMHIIDPGVETGATPEAPAATGATASVK